MVVNELTDNHSIYRLAGCVDPGIRQAERGACLGSVGGCEEAKTEVVGMP
jgi:hypothetical protein